MQSAKTEHRAFFEDVTAPGIGWRRLTIIHCPSFQQGHSWDIREIDDRFRLYRSRVSPRSEKLVGYDLLQFSSKALREYLRKLHAINIALHPTGRVGHDGTTIHLGLYGRGSSSIRLSWWSAAQKEWNEVAVIAGEMIKHFTAAPIFKPDEAEPG